MKFAAGRMLVVLAGVGLSPHAGATHPTGTWWDAYRSSDISSNGVVIVKTLPSARVRIPAGRFTMGSTPKDLSRAMDFCETEILRARCDDVGTQLMSELVAHVVVLSSFSIDRTEVTVENYAACVTAHQCAAPAFVPYDPRFDRPQFPVTHVRWEDAAAYCRFAKGRLPTEAEWEYAARGSSGRIFPWGKVYNPRLANHGAFAPDDTDGSDGFVGLAPVGSFPDGATPTGLLDMAGNAAEWVADFYDVDESGTGYKDRVETNPKGPPIGAYHSVRGGSYRDGATWLRTASRGLLMLPHSATVGFRCAAD